MRAIGKIDDESAARLFGDYLYAQGIDNQIERDAAGGWTVYVHSEDHLDRARQELDRFLQNPQAPVYVRAHAEAQVRREQAARDAAEYERNQINLHRRWFPTGGIGPLTIALIAASIAMALYSGLGDNEKVLNHFFIASAASEGNAWLPEVLHGEVWRLWTPMFLHFGILHLLFNMFWIYDLGTMIERRQSTRLLAALVVVVGLVSNLAQYVWSGPLSGGMSGVVYGLFGYVWIRGRFDPSSGLRATSSNVHVMLVWLILCMTGILGPIGNAAHVSGLVLGAAWGLVAAKMPKKIAA